MPEPDPKPGGHDLTRFTEQPPPTFNAEYAKFLLAREQTQLRPGATDRFTVIIALVTALSGAAISVYNTMVYWADREGRERQETFNNQLSIARLYFERMAGSGFCEKRDDVRLYARTALVVARLNEDTLAAELEASRRQATETRSAPTRQGIEGLATLIYQDVVQRTRDQGDAILPVSTTQAASGAVLDVTPSEELTSYTIKQQPGSARVGAAANAPYAVYLQYAAGSPDRARAEQLRATLGQNPAFIAPGIEGVSRVPRNDQIRIYRRDDEAKARELQAALGLAGAQIVNLQSAFPNLSSRTLEIWLGRP